MKFLLALSCAATLSLTAIHSFANDMPLPERKPSYTNVNADHKTLSKAKFLLEQISIELKKPVEKVSAKPTPEPPPTTTPPQDTQPYELTENLQISRQGDTNMHCGALSSEAMRMRDVIYATQEIKAKSRIQSHAVTAAGAIGSLLIGSVTGGIGLAVGGFLLDHNVGHNANEADNIQDIAEQRRTLMMGIYNAKGCEGPLDHAMQNPEIFDPLARIASIESAAGDIDGHDFND